jgi:hypothetical protein
LIVCTARDDPLQPLEENTTRQHHLTLAARAAHPNIRAYAVNRPFIAAAWVLFAQLHPVAGADVGCIHG